jgi:pyrophosphatase PpaX
MRPDAGTVDTVLFDLDGTLIDTYNLYIEAYRRALNPVLGRDPSMDDFLERRPASERHFLTEWIGEEAALDCHAEMQRHYAELHGPLCDGPYDGVREMLGALRAVGLRLGLVTGKGRGAWEVTRHAIDLGDFEVVVTEDDVRFPKPHPGGLLAAMQSLGARAERTVYVGDSPTDLEAGRAAGTFVGAALWPKTGPGERDIFLAEVARWEPDWVFDRPSDVSRIFAGWCGVADPMIPGRENG